MTPFTHREKTMTMTHSRERVETMTSRGGGVVQVLISMHQAHYVRIEHPWERNGGPGHAKLTANQRDDPHKTSAHPVQMERNISVLHVLPISKQQLHVALVVYSVDARCRL